MKLNFGRRLLLFVHWLMSLALVLALLFPDIALSFYRQGAGILGERWLPIAKIGALVIYGLISLAVLVLIFRRGSKRSERGFITMDSSDTGKVRITVSAIEQMVKQAAASVDGISDMKIGIENLDDAIAINVNSSLYNGAHVPTVTLNLQRAIRQFVEMNCGVAVRSVSVNVNAVTGQPESGRRLRRKETVAAPAPVYTPAPEPTPEPEPEYKPTLTLDPFAQEASQPAEGAAVPEEPQDTEEPEYR